MALTEPSLWNSAHRPVNYRWTYSSYYFTGVIDDGNGKARMAIAPADIGNFSANQRIYIATGTYAGNWTISSVGANYIVTNADYSISTIGSVYPLSVKTVSLYAGYASGHPYYDENPERLIATISAPPGITSHIDINVSGYLKGLFKKVTAPVIGPDWAMSTPFYVIVDSTTYSTRYAVNGTLESGVLNALSANYQVLNVRNPIHFSDYKCLYSILRPTTDPRGAHVLNVAGVHGAGNVGGLGFDAIGTTFTIG